MKKNYNIKCILSLVLFALMFAPLKAQVRLKIVNPTTGAVTLHNYGSSTVNIGTYWLCNFPSYNQLNTLTVTQGSLNLAAGAEVTVTSNVGLSASDSELGLYDSNVFGSSVSMKDYLQWGSAGHQREVVAVNKGIWTAGTFVNAAPPFEYNGNGAQNGAQFWATLGIEDFEFGNSFYVYPNPSKTELNIQLNNRVSKANLEVFDLLGKQIVKQSIGSNTVSQINTSAWISGIYLIKISSEHNTETKRFIKQ